MPASAQELHLIVDRAVQATSFAPGPSTRASGTAAPRVLGTIRVPGLSCLRPGAPDEQLVGGNPTDDDLLIEPLADGPQPRLLLLVPRSASPPRVNGLMAPRICLLRIGDQLLLDDGRLLHLTAFHRSPVVRASEEQAGNPCLICRTPIRAKARVFRCPSCRSLMHHDDPAQTPPDDRLDCATLPRTCPRCQQRVCLEEHFEYVPNPL